MISPEWPRNTAGWKRGLIRGGGSAARISNGIRPQHPGGGEVQLTSFRDETMVWPVIQPTLQWVGLQSGEVKVYAVFVNATQKWVDRTVSTVPDTVEIDVGDMPQWDSRTQSRSGLPLRGGGGEGGEGVRSM